MKKNKLKWLIPAILFVALFPLLGQAQFKAGENVFIPKAQVIEHNYWAAGEVINISGTLKKDLYVAGGSVVIDGIIEGDLIGVATDLKLNGEVKGNLRFAGTKLEINGKVGKTFLFAAEEVTLNSDIGWGATGVAGKVNVNHEQSDNLNIYAAKATLNESVNANVWLHVFEKGQIELADGVHVKGDLSYTEISDVINLNSVIVDGETRVTQPVVAFSGVSFMRLYVYFRFIALLALLLVGFILLYTSKLFVINLNKIMLTDIWNSTFWGMIALLAVPFLVLVGVMTIVGIPLALIVLSIYIIFSYLSKLFVGILLGKYIWKKVEDNKKLVWPMVVGTTILYVLIALPIIGGFVNIFVTALGLGAFIKYLVSKYRVNKMIKID